ncbi:hypothetical protein, partial [Ornithinimicrobium sp. CNJ-824]|uniref:hypothetical protein n=1 Tax=Ornithinimicrobium sp. CNJ-824 TaxID=1904966 RepID=UPI001EDBEB90
MKDVDSLLRKYKPADPAPLPLHLDLSQMEVSEPSALVALLTISDSLHRRNIRATTTLPSRSLLPKEKRFIDRLSTGSHSTTSEPEFIIAATHGRVRRRGTMRSKLEAMGWLQHFAEYENGDKKYVSRVMHPATWSPNTTDPSNESLLSRHVPLTFFDPPSTEPPDPERWLETLSVILGQAGRLI